MFLTPEQLIELTGRQTAAGQARALNKMGITHKRRADGKVVVLAAHVEQALDGVKPGGKNTKTPEPNWSALQNAP